jgi:hypothetical protein
MDMAAAPNGFTTILNSGFSGVSIHNLSDSNPKELRRRRSDHSKPRHEKKARFYNYNLHCGGLLPDYPTIRSVLYRREKNQSQGREAGLLSQDILQAYDISPFPQHYQQFLRVQLDGAQF